MATVGVDADAALAPIPPDAVYVCDACGLPPVHPKKLLLCTRCKRARYHDGRCQRNHYPKHKAECRRIAAANAKAGANDAPSKNAPNRPGRAPTECRSIEGRGRSLFATAPLRPGRCPLPAPSRDGLCGPIAHPVLFESMRGSRCAFCFRMIGNSAVISSPLHRHCSVRCKSSDKDWEVEVRAARRLPHPPLPTALSVSRILRKITRSPGVERSFEELCYNTDILSQDERTSYLSIVGQAHLLLDAMGEAEAAARASDMIGANAALAYKFMSRISMNGFTIATSEALLGHGVYCGASMINHSCRPNSVPTFWLSAGSSPMLRVTTCRSIGVGEEVTIAYCDVTAPRSIRDNSLWSSYKFHCDCRLCKDSERDDKVVGLRCSTKGCKGLGRSIGDTRKCCSRDDGEMATPRKDALNDERSYRCPSCGNDDFASALKSLEASKKSLERFQTETNNGSGDRQKLRKAHDSLKRICDPRTSYYVAWSADIFVNRCANALKSRPNQQEQLHLCREALVAINESRSATEFCIGPRAGNMTWLVKRGMEAKLRLFINPMDIEALKMLKDARKELLVHYPPSDEVIMSFEESLATYSFS